MFYFTDQAVADALLAAHARGVDVRMILDAGSDVGLYDRASCKSCDGDPSSPNFNPLSVEVGMNFLCDVLNTDPSKGPLMIVKTEPWSGKQHNKTAVIDAGVSGGGKSIIGSQNWTGSGEENNDENSFYVKHDALAAEMQADFNSKWNSQLIQDVTPCSYVLRKEILHLTAPMEIAKRNVSREHAVTRKTTTGTEIRIALIQDAMTILFLLKTVSQNVPTV
jgi:phosphatidylserine/phosphatidylglycerophosphate/cardiolipin synthase-like enzyme